MILDTFLPDMIPPFEPPLIASLLQNAALCFSSGFHRRHYELIPDLISMDTASAQPRFNMPPGPNQVCLLLYLDSHYALSCRGSLESLPCQAARALGRNVAVMANRRLGECSTAFISCFASLTPSHVWV
jgi:hypothetical protein